MNAVDDIRIRANVEHVTDAEALAVIEWCRDFAKDCEWQDIDSHEVDGFDLPSLLRACDRHIQGGIAFVLEDVRRVASTDGLDTRYAELPRENAPGMAPGSILPNGATVIASSSRFAHAWVILAMVAKGAHRVEYVTWKASRPGTGADTCHGHYFDSIEDAARDFYARP
jgi:hypothetical protein